MSGVSAKPSSAGPIGSLFGAAHQLDPWLRRRHQAAIGSEIIQRHAAGGEACLELFADRGSAQLRETIDRCDRAGFILDNESGKAIIDDLRDRAAVISDHGGAA